MKSVIIILSLVVVGALSMPYALQYIEEPSRYYQNHTDELYSGNWVPRIFPDDITNIHEQHDIDTNEVWLKFEKGSKSISTINFVKLSSQEKLKLSISMPFFASWWFEGIIEQQPANDGALNAAIFKGKCSDKKSSYLAFSRSSSTVYWWCQYE